MYDVLAFCLHMSISFYYFLPIDSHRLYLHMVFVEGCGLLSYHLFLFNLKAQPSFSIQGCISKLWIFFFLCMVVVVYGLHFLYLPMAMVLYFHLLYTKGIFMVEGTQVYACMPRVVYHFYPCAFFMYMTSFFIPINNI